MAALRRKLKGKKAPKGWEQIEEAIEDFEQQMAEAVDEDHEGKRKAEMTWKIHRIHWEKNRFIYDLMYQRKAISKQLFDWLVREKIADGSLIAKWRKPGYEFLCSLLAIQKGNHNFGTTSHCRVPLKQRAAQQRMTPDVQTGCISCASGDARFGGPIWWNTPLREDDGEAQEADYRTQWEQDGADTGDGAGGADAADPLQPPADRGGPAKRGREDAAAEEEAELPAEVQARLKALRGD